MLLVSCFGLTLFMFWDRRQHFPASSVTDVQARVLNSIFIIIADSDCTWLSLVAALDKKAEGETRQLGKLLHKVRETEPRACDSEVGRTGLDGE